MNDPSVAANRTYARGKNSTAEEHTEGVVAASEKALCESESVFRELADNISQFAWTADATGSIYWYNKRWHDYTGTTLEEMHGWGWQKVHHPDHVERVVDRIRQSFETGTPWEDTFPLRGRDGSYRWTPRNTRPIPDRLLQRGEALGLSLRGLRGAKVPQCSAELAIAVAE